MSFPDDKTMAIIKRPQFGVGDRGVTTLTFSTNVTEASSALQVFYDMEEIKKLLEAYDVSDVHNLSGKPCWVDTSQSGVITWIGPCVIN